MTTLIGQVAAGLVATDVAIADAQTALLLQHAQDLAGLAQALSDLGDAVTEVHADMIAMDGEFQAAMLQAYADVMAAKAEAVAAVLAAQGQAAQDRVDLLAAAATQKAKNSRRPRPVAGGWSPIIPPKKLL